MLTDAKQLELLMDYTKFHIGIYASVMTILLGLVAIGADQNDTKIPSHYRKPLLFVAILFAITGGFAGIVAASIPNHDGEFIDYWNGPIRVFGIESSIMTVGTAARFEHILFWGTVLSSLIVVASKGWPYTPKVWFSVAGIHLESARSVHRRFEKREEAMNFARIMLANLPTVVEINEEQESAET